MCKDNSMKIVIIINLFIVLFLSPVRAEAFIFQDRVAMAKALAHYTMAQIHDLLGQTKLAVLEYQKTTQFDEGSYLAHLRLGANYARLNMLDEAQNELKLVQQYNPEDLQSHYLLALIYSTQKNYEKAAEEYEFILKKFSAAEPQNIEIYGYLGQLYYSQRKYDQAIIQFEKIFELEPENSDVMYLLGSLYLEVDGDERAVELLKKSIEISPDHDGSLNTLGYLYAENSQNLDEALSLVNRALEINPNNGAYLDSLGWVYYRKGMYKEALVALKKADEILKDPVIYEHLGDVYLKLNQREKALEYWELSLELLPGQEELLRKIDNVKNIQARQK